MINEYYWKYRSHKTPFGTRRPTWQAPHFVAMRPGVTIGRDRTGSLANLLAAYFRQRSIVAGVTPQWTISIRQCD